MMQMHNETQMLVRLDRAWRATGGSCCADVGTLLPTETHAEIGTRSMPLKKSAAQKLVRLSALPGGFHPEGNAEVGTLRPRDHPSP